SLGKLALPKLSQRKATELQESVPGKMLKLLLLLLPIVAIYILIAPYFYQFLFPQYTEATVYSQIFALSLLLFPKFLMGQTLTAHALKKQLYTLQITGPSFKIILLLILLPLWGIWGAIIALMATEVFGLLLLLYFFHRKKDFQQAD
ncbi:MAG TPA: polysaccharide biosynthesis C-terminal domain-containing protein, partial [Patescibacteria group bacterium]|nr:polysaccharide biosynthesis C-terminal domain-containing protein [Patescibacteria group bacterium]